MVHTINYFHCHCINISTQKTKIFEPKILKFDLLKVFESNETNITKSTL